MSRLSSSYRSSPPRIAVALSVVALAAPLLATAPPAVAAGKEFRAAYAAAMELYDAGKLEEALAAFVKARDLEAAPEALFGVARCYHRLGRVDEAVAAYEVFLAAAPAHKGAPVARSNLVELLRAMGDRALARGEWLRARDAFERAKTVHAGLDPTLRDSIAGELLAGLGAALAGLGLRADAAAAWRQALAAALAPDVRDEVTARLAGLEGAPPPGTGWPAPAAESAPLLATRPPPAGSPDSSAAPVPARALAPPPLAPAATPAARPSSRRLLPWVAAGGGAALLLGGAAAVLAVALHSPSVNHGFYDFDFRP
jgi:tetratricopeptide (TPR) repeat protein